MICTEYALNHIHLFHLLCATYGEYTLYYMGLLMSLRNGYMGKEDFRFAVSRNDVRLRGLHKITMGLKSLDSPSKIRS